jgi:hypothetical protein
MASMTSELTKLVRFVFHATDSKTSLIGGMILFWFLTVVLWPFGEIAIVPLMFGVVFLLLYLFQSGLIGRGGW